MKKTLAVFSVLFLFTMALPCQGAVIYSTPNPELDVVIAKPAQYGALGLGSYQWLATEFSLGATTRVSRVEGWMMEWPSYAATNNAPVDAVIYSDGGDVPGSRLYSATFTPGDALGWYGPGNLDWLLNEGVYWLAFEVDRSLPGIPYAYEYAMLTQRDSAVNNAGWNKGHNTLNYSPNGLVDLSIRIFDDKAVDVGAAPVPEPSTIVSLGLGLLFLCGYRKRITGKNPVSSPTPVEPPCI